MKTAAITPVPRSLPDHQAAANPRADAEKELLAAAAEHKVRIDVGRMISTSDQTTTVFHAPIDGIEHYGDADFLKGAEVLLLSIHSAAPRAALNGPYVVKAQHRKGATSGEALFVDKKGAVVARRPLIIRTPEQSAVLFPGVYPGSSGGGGPLGIPNITSIHNLGNGHIFVDCAGWQPFRILYFST